MEYIIAGHFEQQAQVAQTIEALARAQIAEDAIAAFYLTPPHTQPATRGETAEDAGNVADQSSSQAGGVKGVAAGVAVGAAAGAAGIPLIGPVAPLLGAFAGAYVGSLAGGLSEIKKTPKQTGSQAEAPAAPRQAGMMVAVCVHQPDQEMAVIAVLREMGATDIERGEGQVSDGRWQDFDPQLPIRRID